MAITGYVSIASLLVALVSLIYGRLDQRRERRRLIEVRIEETLPLPQGADLAKLKVMWGEEVVQQPKLYAVTFTNVGQAALEVADIDRPASVTFVDGEVLGASVGFRVTPANGRLNHYKDIEMEVSKHEVKAPRRLLNSGNQIVFHIVVDGSTTIPEADLGAKNFEVDIKSSEPTTGDRVRTVAMVAAAIGLVTGLLALVSAF